MGYQESYIRMKDSKDFELLVNTIKQNGKDAFDVTIPVEIITLLKPIEGNLFAQCQPEQKYLFNIGEKFIYVVGERSGQRNSYSFFEPCINVSHNLYEEYEDLEIYFTECFPSYDIFENNNGTKMAVHEEFKWK